MKPTSNRRDFLSLMGVGGLVFASGLPGCTTRAGHAAAPRSRPDDFYFLQLSDTHWGYAGAANPEPETTLEHAVATINAVDQPPAFVVFTGDLTHTTNDPLQRRERMKRFRQIVSDLRVPDLRFLAGEHDAALDRGEAYREVFGEPHYSFDHGGVHFVVIDNASQPGGAIGDAQMAWLTADLADIPLDAALVVFAHRPLFPLFPQWEWATQDGDRALNLLARRTNVSVFYGHIHQEHHFQTGSVLHHAARSLIFPLPAPGAAPKKTPLPWDAASPDHGLGWRAIAMGAAPRLTETPWR
jgi:hypothetical protein